MVLGCSISSPRHVDQTFYTESIVTEFSKFDFIGELLYLETPI